MNASELLNSHGELSHKVRSISDVIRHIRTKEKKSTANYSLFLGAGASVTSDIRAATTLIDEWSIELYERFERKIPESAKVAKEYFEKSHPTWYNPANPYSSLFEKKFDLPIQRRRFVEKEVDKKLPSIGYAYLASLVDNNYFNTIFTTNFDDLINEAFYQFSTERPIQCAHDSSVHSISITSKRPKIIKLHGDYLFDDIKSTLRETESLEQNTKEKFVEFSKEYGLIVVGYSGSDRSIMDVLEFLVKQENHLKNGVYWCLRPNDNICHALRNLLWKDKVYPVLIDGFDELFAETHHRLVGGELELKSITKESKIQKTIQNIIEDKYGVSRNQIIRNEIAAIKNDSNQQDISQFLQDLSKGSDSDTQLGITDMRNFLEIQSLTHKDNFDAAYSLCESYFHSCTCNETKPKYIERLISLSINKEDFNAAIRWSDRLIETDSKNVSYYIRKAGCIKIHEERFQFLNDLLPKFPYSPSLLNYTATSGFNAIKSDPTRSSPKIDQLLELLKRSISTDPSLENPAWADLIDVIDHMKGSKDLTSEQAQEELNTLFNQAKQQNPEHSRSLEIQIYQIPKSSGSAALKSHINFLYEIHEKSSTTKRKKINSLICDVFTEAKNREQLHELNLEQEKFFERHIKDIEIEKNAKILLEKAKYFISQKRNLEAAASYLASTLECHNISSRLSDILNYARFANRSLIPQIEEKLEQDKPNLFQEYYHDLKSDIYIENGDLDKAIEHLDKAFNFGLKISAYLSGKTYALLMQEKYEEVIALAEAYNDKIEEIDCETTKINTQFAAYKINSQKLDKTLLRNLSAQSPSNDVKICAFVILENYPDAKRLIKKEIENDYFAYFRFKTWPIVNDKLGDFLTECVSLANAA